MPLSAGTRLGPYEIVNLLGAGGMGEVYYAVDTRLNRPVAIKLVAEHLRGARDFRERFEREASTIAALDHPHICSIFDVGEHADRNFFVMQYLEGETLSSIIARGWLPIEKAALYSAQLADALAAAHRAGVVHRDVKPSNVMVTASGVKLLDFGLTRSADQAPIGVEAVQQIESTVAARQTAPNLLLGTVPYMSPEQLEGRTADARSDIFAAGALIYELFTGRRAFNAPTQAGTIAAILQSTPPAITSVREDAPLLVERIVNRCLAKEPEARWQNAADLSHALRWSAEAAAGQRNTQPGFSSRRVRDVLVVASGLLVAGIAATSLWDFRIASPPPQTSFNIEVPEGAAIGRVDPALAFSSDGQSLVFAALKDGESQLFLRRMNSVETAALATHDGGVSPFFSPDGQWIAFSTRRGIVKVALSGGAPLPIAEGPGFSYGAWSDRQQLAFAAGLRSGLVLIPATGGTPRELTRAQSDGGYTAHRYPEFLPGGRMVIYTAGPPPHGRWYDADIVVQPVDGGPARVLIKGASQARYAASGHLVYSRAGALFAAPFDAANARLTGPAVPVLDGVRESTTGAAQFALSHSGALAYVPGTLITSEVKWSDRTGHVQPLMRNPPRAHLVQPRLSPDGRKLAYVVTAGDDEVWTYDIEQGVADRFASGANHGFPEWTADGSQLTFARVQAILKRSTDAGSDARQLAGAEGVPGSWSPDGRRFVYMKTHPSTGNDIWVFDVERGQQQALVATARHDRSPTISPDGRWLAYVSDESERLEVYVRSFPNSEQQLRVSRDGGTEPRWGRDGKELFFRQGDTLMSAVRTTASAFAIPRSLFTIDRWQRGGSRAGFDVSPDGRFVVVQSSEAADAGTRIRVILDWTDRLNRLVPR